MINIMYDFKIIRTSPLSKTTIEDVCPHAMEMHFLEPER